MLDGNLMAGINQVDQVLVKFMIQSLPSRMYRAKDNLGRTPLFLLLSDSNFMSHYNNYAEKLEMIKL